MTNIKDIKFVRTRKRYHSDDDRCVYQTVWNFSPDGINTESYVVSAVVSSDSGDLCETYIFPSRDESGDDFYGGEVFTSHRYLARQDEHRRLLWKYLDKCEYEQREEMRENLKKFEDTITST